MAIKVGINGFGRIGRNILRAALAHHDVDIVAVNDITDTATLAHLLKYDSVLGNLTVPVSASGDTIKVGSDQFKVFAQKDPALLPWKDVGVDIVFDPVGGAITERAFRALGWRGRHLVVGFAAGTIPALPVNLALLKGAALVGVDYRQFRELEPEQEAANLVALFDLHARNLLNPTIGRVYRFSEFAAALRAASENGPPGRVLLRIRP